MCDGDTTGRQFSETSCSQSCSRKFSLNIYYEGWPGKCVSCPREELYLRTDLKFYHWLSWVFKRPTLFKRKCKQLQGKKCFSLIRVCSGTNILTKAKCWVWHHKHHISWKHTSIICSCAHQGISASVTRDSLVSQMLLSHIFFSCGFINSQAKCTSHHCPYATPWPLLWAVSAH